MNRMIKVSIQYILFFFIIDTCLLIFQVYANEPLKPLLTNSAPVINGQLDDEVWRNAPQVTGFKTFAPDFGRDGSENTITYMLYDSENLYFAFKCHDSEPDKIKTSLSSRDNIISDDWVCINLDSFNDQQALTAFYINSLGIQADSWFAAGNEDFNSDLVWYSAGTLHPDGYTIEVQIPLKSLRYTDNEPVEMSVFFERYISRKSEHSSYPAMDPAKGEAFLTQMKPMVYQNLKHYTLLEILPAVTYSYKSKIVENKLSKDENKPDVSLTAKYGITSKLILDGTVNPDFSQIESDAGQVDVNLRYQLYYSEKRPFFLEGNESFRIAATQASELDPIVSIVHTRTIANPIAGIKLTGKLSEKNTIASIYAADQLPDKMKSFGKYAHTPIVRLKSALSEDSYIGSIYAGTELKGHFNRVFGLDEMYRLPDASMIESHVLFSQTKLNSTTKGQWGHALGLSVWKMTRDLDWGITTKDLSENFIAEMGFVSRPAILSFTGIARPKFYPTSDFFQRFDAEAFTAWTEDKLSNQWETFNHISIQSYFLGALTTKVKYSYSTEMYRGEKFETGGFHILVGGQISKELTLSILYRRVNAIYYERDPVKQPFQGKSNRIRTSLTYQPLEQLRGELSFIYDDFFRSSDEQRIYKYPITRGKLTYQFNKYLFFRGIVEHSNFTNGDNEPRLLQDLLVSFTYIPGTVIYIGYGTLLEDQWQDDAILRPIPFRVTASGLFIKMSYLWRN